MAYQISTRGNEVNIPQIIIYCDTSAELPIILAEIPELKLGDVAYIVEGGDIYMMNSSKNWIIQ